MARSAVGALGWQPGTTLAISEVDGLILAVKDASGSSRITSQGHLQLPFLVIRRCGLEPGSRMLVVADPASHRLVIHPPDAIDEMVAQAHAARFGGGQP